MLNGIAHRVGDDPFITFCRMRVTNPLPHDGSPIRITDCQECLHKWKVWRLKKSRHKSSTS